MSKILKLSEIPANKEYVITGFNDPNSIYTRKLISMGFSKGTMIKRANTTIKDPLVYTIRNVYIALRKKEAGAVMVK